MRGIFADGDANTENTTESSGHFFVSRGCCIGEQHNEFELCQSLISNIMEFIHETTR